MKKADKTASTPAADEKRRDALARLGRFAAATPPAVALLLAANTKPAKALPGSPTDLSDST